MLASTLRHCRTSLLLKNRPYSAPAAPSSARRTRLMAAEDIGAGLSAMPPSSGILLNELDQASREPGPPTQPLPAAPGDRTPRPSVSGMPPAPGTAARAIGSIDPVP